MREHDLTAMLLDVLTPLALHYPEAGYSPAQLQVLAADWCEDLAGYDLALVREAAKKARRGERFFPKVAVLLGYCADLAARRPARPLALPDAENAHSPERRQRNAVSAAMLVLSLRDRAAKEFFDLKDWTAKEALARRMLGDSYPEPDGGNGTLAVDGAAKLRGTAAVHMRQHFGPQSLREILASAPTGIY